MISLIIKPRLEIIILIFLTIFSFIVRIINLNFPNHLMYDEIYRVARAQKFLSHEVFFTAQPHFTRYLIILGILLFGDNPIGWRITQVVTGTLIIPMFYLIGKRLFKHKHAGLLSAFFITFSPSLLAYSRVGIATIHQIFFIVFSLLLFILATESKNNSRILFYFLSAITTGLAIATKWTSLFLIPVFWLWLKTRENIKSITMGKIFFNVVFLLLVLCTYTITFAGEGENFNYLHQKFNTPNSNFVEGFVSWHKLAFTAHAKKNTYHPCSSKWYTWPLLYKPVLIYMKVDTINNKVTTILGIGNPIIRWCGTLAILFQLFLLLFMKDARKDKIIIFLLGAYFISFLPYAFIKRPMFLYHYLPSLLFQVLILEYTFINLYKKIQYFRPIFWTLLILMVTVFFYFYPLVNGYPISITEYNNKLWFKSWKEYKLTKT